MTDAPQLCAYRIVEPGDIPFVLDSWVRSYEQHAVVNDHESWPLGVPATIYKQEHRNMVADIVDRSRTVIAHVPDDKDHLVGFICFEQQGPSVVVHYLYVKESFRRLGIGSRLFIWPAELSQGREMYASHWNQYFAKDIKKQMVVLYNPYRCYYG